MINLGDKVRDTVSGFEGIVVCRSEWLNGCVRYTVTPRVNSDGKALEDAHFDVEQLEVVDSEAVVVALKAKGGPTSSNPARM